MTLQEARQFLHITVDFIPVSNLNRPGTPLTPRQITIHNTDNSDAGANAHAHSIYMKGADAQQRQVSWHFTVDDKAVYQSLPVGEVGWHAGHGNASSIGIEICENAGIDQNAANQRAALLTAVLLKENGITPDGHVVQHNFWTGKDCPHLLRHGHAWPDFLALVRHLYDDLDGSHGDDCTNCAMAMPVMAVHAHDAHHGTSNASLKPPVDDSHHSPYHSSRNGGEITGVVMHFTDGGTLESVVSYFGQNSRQVSAHYVIGRDGRIAQMVSDSDRANHCRGANRNTIGIEHVADPGQRMSAEQERSSIQLVRWLYRQYEIPKAGITGHRFTPGYTGGEDGTDCPHSLFGARTKVAIRNWVEQNIVPDEPLDPPAPMDGLHPAAAPVAAAPINGGVSFSTEPAHSGNADGSSETSGLHGTTTTPAPGTEVTDASETIHAVRNGHNLGTKSARQVRTKQGHETRIEQTNYCWKDRTLPTVILEENADGLSGPASLSGTASYFGKYDTEDEGTGSPAFKTVQTNSSVFAMSLPRATLLAHDLAEEVDGLLRATERGLTVLVEVYSPLTHRLMKLPLADQGPGASTHKVADLSAAAVAWLLGRPERDANHYHLPNPGVEVRIPA